PSSGSVAWPAATRGALNRSGRSPTDLLRDGCAMTVHPRTTGNVCKITGPGAFPGQGTGTNGKRTMRKAAISTLLIALAAPAALVSTALHPADTLAAA